MQGGIATIVLSDRDGDKRRKPRGAASALVWRYVGELPPAHRDQWKFAGMTTRTMARIAFDAALEPGTKVWLTACWCNSRGKQSRQCEPVMMHAGGAGAGPMMQQPAALRSAQALAAPGFATAA